MGYNFTALENGTNILELFTTVNTASNELFMGLILISLWIIMFIAFKGYDTVTALQSSFFIVSIVAILGNIVGLLSTSFMMIPIVATGILILYGVIKND